MRQTTAERNQATSNITQWLSLSDQHYVVMPIPARRDGVRYIPRAPWLWQRLGKFENNFGKRDYL